MTISCADGAARFLELGLRARRTSPGSARRRFLLARSCGNSCIQGCGGPRPQRRVEPRPCWTQTATVGTSLRAPTAAEGPARGFERSSLATPARRGDLSAGGAARRRCSRRAPRRWPPLGARRRDARCRRPAGDLKFSSPTTEWSGPERAHQAAGVGAVLAADDRDDRGRLVLVDDVEATQLGLHRRGSLEPGRPGQPAEDGHATSTAATATSADAAGLLGAVALGQIGLTSVHRLSPRDLSQLAPRLASMSDQPRTGSG